MWDTTSFVFTTYRVLELLDREEKRRVVLDPALDRRDAVDHRRVVTLEELPEARDRRVQQSPAQVNRDMPGGREVPAAAAGRRVARPEPEALADDGQDAVVGDTRSVPGGLQRREHLASGVD